MQKLKQTFDIDIWDKLSDNNKDQFIQDFDINNWDKLTHEQKEKNKDLFLYWIQNDTSIGDIIGYVKTLNQENKDIINNNLTYIHAEKRYVRYESETG